MKQHKKHQRYVSRRLAYIQQQAKARIVSVRSLGTVKQSVSAPAYGVSRFRDSHYRTTLEVEIESLYGHLREDKARVILGGSDKALHFWLMSLPQETRIALLQESLMDAMESNT